MFNLGGKTVTDLTIDIRGLAAGETITVTSGTVTNLIIYNNAAANLDIGSVNLPNGFIVK